MSYANILLRPAIAALLVGGIVGSMAACATTTPESHHRNDAKAHQAPERDHPENLAGCNGISINSQQRGDLGTNGAVNEQDIQAVVVHANVGSGSHIGLTGEGSCLWITGDVGPNVSISVSGNNSGIVVKGTVDPSVRIDVSGAGSITWLPKVATLGFAGRDAPDLRIAGTGGGTLIINGLEEIPH